MAGLRGASASSLLGRIRRYAWHFHEKSLIQSRQKCPYRVATRVLFAVTIRRLSLLLSHPHTHACIHTPCSCLLSRDQRLLSIIPPRMKNTDSTCADRGRLPNCLWSRKTKLEKDRDENGDEVDMKCNDTLIKSTHWWVNRERSVFREIGMRMKMQLIRNAMIS